MVNWAPGPFTIADRSLWVLLGPTVKLNFAAPEPVVRSSVSHEEAELTVHTQVAGAVMEIAPTPPVRGNCNGDNCAVIPLQSTSGGFWVIVSPEDGLSMRPVRFA